MDWTIYSYDGGDFLRLVFNGVASIFGNNDFLVAMKLSALLGLMAVVIRAAFDRDALQNFRWLIGMIFLYMVALVPKTTVIITDKIAPANSSVVQNVPIGLAATAGFFSGVGNWLTTSFETVFSLPDQVNYTTNGMLFGHKLLDSSRKMKLPDERTYINFMEFFNSCVVIDGVGHGRFTWQDVMKSSDLVDFFGTRVSQNVAFFSYTDSSGNVANVQCRSGYNNNLLPDIQGLESEIIKNGASAFVTTEGSIDAAAIKLSSNMSTVVNTMTNINQSSAFIAFQNAQINAINDSLVSLAQQTNAAEFIQTYTTEKAEVERRTTYRAMSDLASTKLPMLKGLFEAFLYAIFPVVALMAIVIPTKVPLSYTKALVWISMWAPIYAIIHFSQTYYSHAYLPEITSINGGGFTVLNNAEMMKHLADTSETAGYLAMSIPLIAWMFVSQSGAMMASLAGRVLQGYDSSVGHSANEALSNERGFAGADYQATANGQQQVSSINDSGIRSVTHGDGSETFTNPQSNTQLSVDSSQSYVDSTRDSLSSAQSHMEQTSFSAASSNVAALDSIDAAAHVISSNQSASDTYQDSAGSHVSNAIEQRNAITDQVASAAGVSREDTEAIMGSLSAKTPTPFVSASGKMDVGTREVDQESYNAVVGALSSQSISNNLSNTLDSVHSTVSKHDLGYSDSDREEMRNISKQQEQAQLSYSEAHSRVDTAMETHDRAKELRESISLSGTDGFINIMSESEGVSQSTIAGLINDAARGDSGAQSLLSTMQQNFISGRAPTDTEGNNGLNYSEGRAVLEDRYLHSSEGIQGANSNYSAMINDQYSTASSLTNSTVDAKSSETVSTVTGHNALAENRVESAAQVIHEQAGITREEVEYEQAQGDKTAAQKGVEEVVAYFKK